MSYTIRRARLEDLLRILEIYSHARKYMAENGNPYQWGTTHPQEKMLREDIRKGQLYVIVHINRIVGVFAFILGADPTYNVIDSGKWSSDCPYGTIHRIAGDGSGGILHASVEYCLTKTDYLRIDTHADNRIMQRAIAKEGFTYCGVIYVEDGSPRLAYDRTINYNTTANKTE